ncbi:MAG: dihydroxyacetone kinase subunit L [Rhodobacteraceae bacterium]|nr:dihydroxyacetone kinase subunit L [Paracoccaceae bacterium]
MAEAKLHAVTKRFDDTTAIADMSLEVGHGEFVVLLGPTGAGKTTTLRLFAGLETPDVGRVEIDGIDVTTVPPAERDVAFVFQQYSLYPHLTVFDNLAFPLRAPGRKRPEAEVKKRVQDIAEMLRIESKLKNRSTVLSGGEMQRVSIGRALVREPNLFLMDEPLSSLDAKLREDLRVELKRIQRDLGATVLYVTHDQLEAMTLADRIGVMGEGRLAQIAAPREVYDQPANIYAAQRLGSPQINLLDIEQLGPLPAPEGAARMGLRPEDVRLNGAGVEGRALTVEHLGVETVALLEVGGAHVHALLDAGARLQEGDAIRVSARPGATIFFNQEGVRMEPTTPTPANPPNEGATPETALLLACIEAAAKAISDNEAEIEGLDRAIGDGDHYHNMKRGAETLLAMREELAAKSPDEALKAIAKKLVMTIGGASGPLLASYFLDMSKVSGAAGPWSANTAAAMATAGAEAVKARGKADIGMKTMLDVLIPVAQSLTEMAAASRPHEDILTEIPQVAETGLLSTKDMLAAKGRAAFLGERAIGHLDPGSKSCAVIISAICETVRSRAL